MAANTVDILQTQIQTQTHTSNTNNTIQTPTQSQKQQLEFDNVAKYFLSNLNTLSLVKNGDKLYIDTNTNDIKIDEPFMFQGFWRYCNNVSRKDSVYIIKKIYNDIELYVNALFLKDTQKQVNHSHIRVSAKLNTLILLLIEQLDNSIKGISNLAKTYETDAEIVGEFSKLIEKCKLLCASFKKMI